MIKRFFLVCVTSMSMMLGTGAHAQTIAEYTRSVDAELASCVDAASCSEIIDRFIADLEAAGLSDADFSTRMLVIGTAVVVRASTNPELVDSLSGELTKLSVVAKDPAQAQLLEKVAAVVATNSFSVEPGAPLSASPA